MLITVSGRAGCFQQSPDFGAKPLPESLDTPHEDEVTGSSRDSLAARALRYRDETERVVRNVGEHPQYELKRSYDFANLHQRMEFIKDMQSIATSRIEGEKFLVIGADEASRQLVPVANPQDFDDAKIRQQLERYLSPAPKFEIFRLTTSDGVPFILFVIGRQPTRRILARVTVDDPSEQKPRTLLREGDLWTKGDSTGKRLARPDDWDAIYEEAVEREAETRTRARTDHVVQQVIAQERIRAISGGSFALPAYLTDVEFKSIAEEICVRNDVPRLSVLLERLRDDLIEGWHKLKAYDEDLFRWDPSTIPEFRLACQTYRDNVFRPAIGRLILLGIGIVKNRGSVALFEETLHLIRETYNTSESLYALRLCTARGSHSTSVDEHISHTTLALESLLAIYVVGAYIAKRRRFDYFRPLLAQEVFPAGLDSDQKRMTQPLAMWPLHGGWGEPATLRYRAGRVDLCVARIVQDEAIASFFGDEPRARFAVIEFEFLVELNSFLAVDNAQTPATSKYMREAYPTTDFSFWPSLVAFDMGYITGIAGELFADFDSRPALPLSEVLRDANEAKILTSSGRETYLRFLRSVQDAHEKLMFELRRSPGYINWPRKIQDALKTLPRQ
jgi:hypothetical protein